MTEPNNTSISNGNGAAEEEKGLVVEGDMVVDGHNVNVEIHDAQSSDTARAFAYAYANISLIFFSIIDPDTLTLVIRKVRTV